MGHSASSSSTLRGGPSGIIATDLVFTFFVPSGIEGWLELSRLRRFIAFRDLVSITSVVSVRQTTIGAFRRRGSIVPKAGSHAR
jgi:hypothetical protein